MDYLSGWCKSKRRLEGSTIIVTGSNTGLGRETASDLYKRGASVIMACRNVITAKEVKEEIEQSTRGQEGTGELLVEHLDLCSFSSVRQFVQRVTSRERRLRVLVCNAGVMMCPEGRTEDGFETHIGSNHLGHALLTLLLLPLLIQSAPSRIVFLSSRIHQCVSNIQPLRKNLQPAEGTIMRIGITAFSADYVSFYHRIHDKVIQTHRMWPSREYLYKLIGCCHREHHIKGVTTYSLHPGIVKTGIGRHFPDTAWSIITYGFQNYLLNWCWKTPRCGAQTTIYCAVDEKCENESGFYYSDCAKTSPSRQCKSESDADKLWNVTIDMLNLQDYNPFIQGTSKL